MAGPIRIAILANAAKANAELKSTETAVGRIGSRTSAAAATMTKAFGGIAAAAAGLGVVAAVGGLIKGAFEEAREAAKIGRLTEAAIRSTGGAARVTAKDIDKLSNTLSVLNGVDDELVQGSANLLLTFTNIRNETGKGNKIFNMAAVAIQDMTAAMNHGEITAEGLKSSTIQVGKALNDPIKGLTALSRVGVTFTEGQKNQIAALVKTGKTMQAQKIILAELNKEFGGAATAAADPAQRAQVAWGNFKETVGNALLPVLGNLATFFTDRIVPVLEQKLIPAVQRTASWIGDNLVPVIRDRIIPALQQFGGFIIQEVLPRLRALWAYIQANILPVLKDLAVRGFNGAREAVAQLREAFTKHRAELTQVFNAFKRVADFIVQKVLPVLGPILSASIRGGILIMRGMIATISLVVRAFNGLVAGVKAAVNGIVAAFNAVVGFFRGLPGRIKSALGNLGSLLFNVGRDIIQGMINGIKSMIGRLVDAARDTIGRIPGAVKKLLGIGSPSKVFARFGRQTIQGYVKGLEFERRRLQLARVLAETLLLDDGSAPRRKAGAAGPMRLHPQDLNDLARLIERRPVVVQLRDGTAQLADLMIRGN